MDEKPLASTHSAAPTPDIESEAAITAEHHRERRLKIVVYIALFILFQTLIITTFAATVMRVRRPKFRLQSVNIQNLTISNSTDSPSFAMRFDVEISLKNRNFGPYNFDGSFLIFSYKDFPVGEAAISGSNVKFLSTKKMRISLNVNSESARIDSSLLGREISSGRLEFNVVSHLRGQVEVLKVLMKKYKATDMNCSIRIDLVKKVVQELKCD